MTSHIRSPLDHVLISLSLFILGLLLGVLFQATVRDYFWFLVIALVLLLIKPLYSYWRYRERRRDAEAIIRSMDDRR